MAECARDWRRPGETRSNQGKLKNECRTSNIERSMLDVRCSMFNLFTVSASLIIKKPCHFGVVSYEYDILNIDCINSPLPLWYLLFRKYSFCQGYYRVSLRYRL